MTGLTLLQCLFLGTTRSNKIGPWCNTRTVIDYASILDELAGVGGVALGRGITEVFSN